MNWNVRIRAVHRPVELPCPAPEEVHRIRLPPPEVTTVASLMEMPEAIQILPCPPELPSHLYLTSLTDFEILSIENLWWLSDWPKESPVMMISVLYGQEVFSIPFPESLRLPSCLDCGRPLALYRSAGRGRCPQHWMMWEWTEAWQRMANPLPVSEQNESLLPFLTKRKIQMLTTGLPNFLNGNIVRVCNSENQLRTRMFSSTPPPALSSSRTSTNIPSP